MNGTYTSAFLHLKVSDQQAVAQRLGITMSQGRQETNAQYAQRILQMIEKDGNVRDLERALLDYT